MLPVFVDKHINFPHSLSFEQIVPNLSGMPFVHSSSVGLQARAKNSEKQSANILSIWGRPKVTGWKGWKGWKEDLSLESYLLWTHFDQLFHDAWI